MVIIFPMFWILIIVVMSYTYPFKIKLSKDGFYIKTLRNIKKILWNDISEMYTFQSFLFILFPYQIGHILILKNNERFYVNRINKKCRDMLIIKIRQHGIKEIHGFPEMKKN